MIDIPTAIAAVTHLGKPPAAAIVGGHLVLTDGCRLLAIAGAEVPAGLELLGKTSCAALAEHFARVPTHVGDTAALRAWCGGPWAEKCDECEGTGKRRCSACFGDGWCDGECGCCGTKVSHECGRCDGSGKSKCKSCCDGAVAPVVEGRVYGGGFDRALLWPLLALVDSSTVELGVDDADTFPLLTLVWPGHRVVLMGLRRTQDDAAVWPVSLGCAPSPRPSPSPPRG